jgi:uncharacterized membrane protein YphA (DoxX/SURF4 family)
MERLHWHDENRELAWAALRVYIGVALFIKGVVYLMNVGELASMMQASGVPFASTTLAHLVAFLHMSGGLLLAFGFVTRFAAALQMPIVLGAIVFVHLREGLFRKDQSLELAALVLVVLAVFAVTGGGRWSMDGAFSARGAPETEHGGVIESARYAGSRKRTTPVAKS